RHRRTRFCLRCRAGMPLAGCTRRLKGWARASSSATAKAGLQCRRRDADGPGGWIRSIRGTCIRRAQQVVEMPDAALAFRAQASALVTARGEAALHRFADQYIFHLHLITELGVAGNARLRLVILCVMEIKLDAATLHAQRQDAIGLQATRH